MNEQLEKLLVWMEAGGDLAAEQLPLVANEILMFYAVWYTALAVTTGLTMAICWRINFKDPTDKFIARKAFVFLGGTAFIFSFYYGLMIWLAPRLFLIEKVKALIS